MPAFRMLHRYLLARFLWATLATLGLCAILIFMIDFVEMLRQAGKYGSVAAPTLVWLTLLRLPAYAEFLLAFAMLVGSMATLLLLNRKSELAVMRSAGMSVWQFIWPGLLVAGVLGLLAVLVFNPVAAGARAYSEQLFAATFGREANLLKAQGGGSWLRQDGPDGPSVIHAGAAASQGLDLAGVTIYQYDREDRFIEQIDGRRARLMERYWQVDDAVVTRVGREPEKFGTYFVGSYLDPERVQDALGTVISVSVWDLPGLIEVAEKSGLSANRYRVQYQLLLSRPLLLVAMVLLGATVSLRSFRSGRVQTMVTLGMIGGLGFFLAAEVSRQFGVAGLVPATAAAWIPVFAVILLSLTVLLHQEDG